MKPDRMAAYEAPRPVPPQRPMREIILSYHGKQQRTTVVTLIPKAMALPDIITYRGRSLVRRGDDTYTEATVWPIVEGLDRER